MKKTVLISLALVLALGTLGVAYAMWDKTLYVDGTVYTGEVNACIMSIADDDNGVDPYYGELVGMPPTPVYPLKDVADTTVGKDELDCQRAWVDIDDGYPCYWVAVHLTVYNTGSIPIVYTGVDASAAPKCITVDAGDSVMEQIDPKGHLDYTIYFHVGQTCTELTDYPTFAIGFHFEQYNEAVID